MKKPCNACKFKVHIKNCPKCGRSCRCYKKPTVVPKLTRNDAQLAYDALGVWRSDYNNAPHDDIEKLRTKLMKMGATHDS